jgi:hypothetical protein
VSAPPDDAERLVLLAEARAHAGEHTEAVRLFEEVSRDPSSAFADRALLGLTRSLCNREYAGHDYVAAYVAADRLLREHPDSRYAEEARVWRDLLEGHLARGQELARRLVQVEGLVAELERQSRELQRLRGVDLELERRTRELDQRTRELDQRTQELERLKHVDVELERRTRELDQRTHELERLKRVDLELERRTQELERLKRLDLELERKRTPERGRRG